MEAWLLEPRTPMVYELGRRTRNERTRECAWAPRPLGAVRAFRMHYETLESYEILFLQHWIDLLL